MNAHQLTLNLYVNSLRAPEEIRYDEIMMFWQPLNFRLWSRSYTVYLSPNRELQAWINEDMKTIAILWNRYTGVIHQVKKEALYELIKEIGGWI